MNNTYNIRTSRGTLLRSINERERFVTAGNVVLHGRGAKNYYLDRNQNLVYLLENFAGSPAPTNPLDGMLWWDVQNKEMMVYNEFGSPDTPQWQTVVPAGQGVGFTIVAGQGLTFPGSPGVGPNQSQKPVGSPLTITLEVNAGTGITLTADTVSINTTAVDHDQITGGLSSFTNQHIDHSSVTVGGSGIGVDGGTTPLDITTSRTLFVNGGDGITELTNTIQVESSVVRITGGTWGGNKTFTAAGSIRVADGTAGAPAYSFNTDTDTGMYRSGINELSFSTGGSQRFRIESNGVLRSLNATYETLVTEDDDIPNKKYVDDAAASLGTVTENTFSSITFSATTPNSISGLTAGKKYLVSVYGPIRNGELVNTFGSARVTSGSSPTSGLLWASPTFGGVNWPDGNFVQHASTVITAPAGGTIYGWTDYISSSWYQIARAITAVQLD